MLDMLAAQLEGDSWLQSCSMATVVLCCTTGEDVTVDMEKNVLINHTTGKEYALKALGDVSRLLLLGFCWSVCGEMHGPLA